jgi:hypothetical protein
VPALRRADPAAAPLRAPEQPLSALLEPLSAIPARDRAARGYAGITWEDELHSEVVEAEEWRSGRRRKLAIGCGLALLGLMLVVALVLPNFSSSARSWDVVGFRAQGSG